MSDLEATGAELARVAEQVAGIAIELKGAAHDLGGNPEALRHRALGVQAEATRLALAALAAARSGEQIAGVAKQEAKGDG
jgi:hypothetical protein